MDIKIEERVIGHVTVLDIVGRLTIDEAAGHLKDKINSLIAQQRTHIIANLRKVPYIDSGGLGELVASYGRAPQRLLRQPLFPTASRCGCP